MTEVISQQTKTVFCIALEGNWATGSDWYYKQEDRDAAIGNTGAEHDIPFAMKVPFHANRAEITYLVDSAAWNKIYEFRNSAEEAIA